MGDVLNKGKNFERFGQGIDRATWGIDRGLVGQDRVLQVGIRAFLILLRTVLKDAEFQTEIISENYDDLEP